MATSIEQLQAMRSMRENWDGYGADAPAPAAIDLAQEFVGLIETMWKKSTANSCALHVSPTRNGGVLIEWEDRAMKHEVEISRDRSLSFLHFDKTTGQMEPQEEDSLIDELLQTNPKFQALVAKSKASPRKPFALGDREPDNITPQQAGPAAETT